MKAETKISKAKARCLMGSGDAIGDWDGKGMDLGEWKLRVDWEEGEGALEIGIG